MTHSNTNGKSHEPSRLRHTNLIKRIYDQEHPEQFVRQLPAQSLYLALKQAGIESASDLVRMSSREQCQLMLDFDLWKGDRFFEDNLWDWLALPDQEENNLDILHILLRSVDLKLIALLIAKYVQIEVFEEPTDLPPGVNFYTPDKGYTWIQIVLEDSHKHFLLGRLLAFLFDNDARVFYQLISIPGVSTNTILEEESFQDRNRRLESEGFPQLEEAAEVNSPLALSALKQEFEKPLMLSQRSTESAVSERRAPAFLAPSPLSELLSEIHAGAEIESQLSYLMNAALVHFQVEHFEVEQVKSLIESVKGAVNIGLELVLQEGKVEHTIQAYERLGLIQLYRLGLKQLFELRKMAHRVTIDSIEEMVSKHLLEGLQLPMPLIPIFLKDDGTVLASEQQLSSERKAISHLQTCTFLRDLISRMARVN